MNEPLNACRQPTLNTGCCKLTLRVAVVGASGLPPSIWVFLPCIPPGLWPAHGSPYPSHLPWLPLHQGHRGWWTYHPTRKFGIRSGAFQLGWRFEQPGKSEKLQVKILLFLFKNFQLFTQWTFTALTSSRYFQLASSFSLRVFEFYVFPSISAKFLELWSMEKIHSDHLLNPKFMRFFNSILPLLVFV